MFWNRFPDLLLASPPLLHRGCCIRRQGGLTCTRSQTALQINPEIALSRCQTTTTSPTCSTTRVSQKASFPTIENSGRLGSTNTHRCKRVCLLGPAAEVGAVSKKFLAYQKKSGSLRWLVMSTRPWTRPDLAHAAGLFDGHTCGCSCVPVEAWSTTLECEGHVTSCRLLVRSGVPACAATCGTIGIREA